MIVVLAPEATESYLKLTGAGEDTDGVDEFLEVLDSTLPRQLRESAPDEFRLGRFPVHRLQGVLAGWWSASAGVLSSGRTLIVVFYAEGHKVSIAAIAEHDAAYRTAQIKRAKQVPSAARRKAILRRIR